MADDMITTQYERGRAVGVAGSEAGKTAKYNEIAQQAAKDAFLKSKGWSGLGGASKRKPGWEKSPEFLDFAKNYAKSQGQKKAMTEKTLPLPNPTPSPNEVLMKDEKK